MFLEFFYELRAHSIPVSTREYLDFIKAMENLDTIGNFPSLEDIYQIARTTLIKDIKHYDAYDLAFGKVFSNYSTSDDLHQRMQEWLKQAKEIELSEERKQNAMNLQENEILKELQKRLAEQKERHDGGNYWVGTGGTSAFGNSGFNPQGIRVGGSSKAKSAIAVAGERNFKDYRSDIVLNTRNIKIALKKVKELKKTGEEKIDIDKSIRKTIDNAGEIEIEFSRERKNNLKLILLMDVGGSMTPFSESVEKLFSSAHNLSHFKKFLPLYFHNIFYDKFYKDARLMSRESFSFEELKKKYPRDTRFIIVGDAYMAPYELFQMTGSMNDFYRNFMGDPYQKSVTGIESLKKLKKRYKNCVWLNPETPKLWNAPTIKAVRSIMPMYELTIDGLNKACKSLV
tara:strand:+ start:19789 stop:20985 length:1197 start_codon:yes stop_codon:yes gene_type:complete